jgi:hypothetical protein
MVIELERSPAVATKQNGTFVVSVHEGSTGHFAYQCQMVLLKLARRMGLFRGIEQTHTNSF